MHRLWLDLHLLVKGVPSTSESFNVDNIHLRVIYNLVIIAHFNLFVYFLFFPLECEQESFLS